MPTRDELWDLLRANGAETRDTMAKYVNLLLIGEGYGQNKIAAARKWSCATISLPMAEYLGLLNEQGNLLKVDPQLKGVLPDMVINHAFLCELLYGHFIRLSQRGDPRASLLLGCFYQLAAGLDELLRVSWGSADGGSTEASGGIADLIRSLESVRAATEEHVRAGGE